MMAKITICQSVNCIADSVPPYRAYSSVADAVAGDAVAGEAIVAEVVVAEVVRLRVVAPNARILTNPATCVA
jgi:hypothetical protein